MLLTLCHHDGQSSNYLYSVLPTTVNHVGMWEWDRGNNEEKEIYVALALYQVDYRSLIVTSG